MVETRQRISTSVNLSQTRSEKHPITSNNYIENMIARINQNLVSLSHPREKRPITSSLLW
jgi:hypothetical protein